jgi:hypothetical protein
MLYGKHYFMGDRITLRWGDLLVHKRIVGRQIRVQGAKEQISLDLASFTTGTQ